MTKNEIKKALDCFSGKEIYCKNCAYRDNSNMGICRRNAAKDTIDLINRQKAEIERLEEILGGTSKVLAETCVGVRVKAIKEFAERLKTEADGYSFCGDGTTYQMIDVEDIDNLVKEMVGENK